MNVILFGASGMVGQGVLRECVRDPRVERVLCVVRGPLGILSPKVETLVQSDFHEWGAVEDRFAGYDTCFFPLAVSALGMSEGAYRETTFDLTRGVAEALARVGSLWTFVYVSGEGTNANGRQMWARVKGETEEMLLAMPFAEVFCFRPGYIQPLDGVRSKTGWYNAMYDVLRWVYPVLRRLAPGHVTTTSEVGRAMIAVAETGFRVRVLGNREIREAAGMAGG
jgi:uncharacterized protein YbjT (DUF2867 family)